MLVRPRRTLDVLSISALDLFASALGVFVLMTILLFPFYLKQPSIEADLAGAQADLSASGLALTEARSAASEAAEARATAAALRSRSVDELQQAEASVAEAEQALQTAASRSRDVGHEMASVQQELSRLAIADLDLVFVMDATGSMRQEIEDVQRSLLGIVRVLHRLAPTLSVGFVAFRDTGEEYVTRAFPLSPMTGGNLAQIQGFVQRMSAKGGGDYPEAVAQALRQAVDMDWRDEAQGRIVLIGDAPAHPEDWPRVFTMVTGFRDGRPSGALPRAVSAIFTGNRDAGREFYQRLAEAGGGDYVAHQGRMMESVLLSVLNAPAGTD